MACHVFSGRGQRRYTLQPSHAVDVKAGLASGSRVVRMPMWRWYLAADAHQYFCDLWVTWQQLRAYRAVCCRVVVAIKKKNF